MYCSKCGKENNDSSKFCKYCGKELKQHIGVSTADEQIKNTSSVETVKENKDSNKSLVIIAFAILAIVVILATTFIIYYFVIRDDKSSANIKTEEAVSSEVTDEQEAIAEQTNTEDVIDSKKIIEEAAPAIEEAEPYIEEAEPYIEETEEIEEESRPVNLLALYDSYAEASSELNVTSKDNATYVAGNAIDGDYRTAWVEGVDGCGENQTITIHLDGTHSIKNIKLYTGFLKTWARYVKNGKVTNILIDYCNGQSQEVALNYNIDLPEEEIEFAKPLIDTCSTEITPEFECETDTITITIIGAVAGSKYEDTAISEIEIYGN